MVGARAHLGGCSTADIQRLLKTVWETEAGTSKAGPLGLGTSLLLQPLRGRWGPLSSPVDRPRGAPGEGDASPAGGGGAHPVRVFSAAHLRLRTKFTKPGFGSQITFSFFLSFF